jgi:carboxylesterase type B
MPAILRNRPNEQTRELSLEAHRMWASFARNGVPSEDWPVCEEDDRAFMTIGDAGFKASRDCLPEIIRGFEGKYLL